MKNGIILSGLVLLILLVGNVSGTVIDENIYASLAPCYTDYVIKSYGPVPVFDKNHTVISKGVTADFTSFIERDNWYKKLSRIYEATMVPVDENSLILEVRLSLMGMMPWAR